MMRIYALAFFIVFSVPGNSQIDTLWTRSLGGSADDVVGLTMIGNLGAPGVGCAVTADGMIYAATSTLSADGLVQGPSLGMEDIWLVKMNATGDIIWNKRIGGNAVERTSGLIAMSDGGVVMVGRTYSTTGDFSSNHSSMNDGFLMRLNADGEILWVNCYGGSADDFLYDVVLDINGDLVACGETGSSNGDLLNTGSGLNWVIKVNAGNGNLIWSKAYIGTDHAAGGNDFLENFYCLHALSDGSGYLCAGFTTPFFADFNQDDILYAKIDIHGNLLWMREFGSSTGADYAASIVEAGDGGFFIAGRLSGSGGDVSNYYGGSADCWIVRFDAEGNHLWNRNYGGSDLDFAFDALADPDGNIWMAAFTRSANFEASAPSFGGMDCFILKLEPVSGDVLESFRYGGLANDLAMRIELMPGGTSPVVAGRTYSSDTYIHGHNGGSDLYISRLEGPPLLIEQYESNTGLSVYPNPSNGTLHIHATSLRGAGMMSVTDLTGRAILRESKFFDGHAFQTSFELESGIYILTLSTGGMKVSERIRVY